MPWPLGCPGAWDALALGMPWPLGYPGPWDTLALPAPDAVSRSFSLGCDHAAGRYPSAASLPRPKIRIRILILGFGRRGRERRREGLRGATCCPARLGHRNHGAQQTPASGRRLPHLRVPTPSPRPLPSRFPARPVSGRH